MARVVGRARHVPDRWRRPAREGVLLPDDVPVPVGDAARGSRAELHHRRRGEPVQDDGWPGGSVPHGLGCLRPARRERRHQTRGPAGPVGPRQHRLHETPVPPVGRRLRLATRGQHLHARLLQVDPVDLPGPLRARPGVPEEGPRQLVPLVPDGPGERRGCRRRLRTLRRHGRETRPGPVVLPHHRVRPAVAGRSGGTGPVARDRPHDAGQLDRPKRRRPRRFRPRGRHADAVLHHAARHALGRHVHEPGARAPDHRGPGARHRPRRGGPGVLPAVRPSVRGRPGRRGGGEGGSLHGGLRHQSRQRRARAPVGRQLRTSGVRHGGGDGGARPRPARLRVREEV